MHPERLQQKQELELTSVDTSEVVSLLKKYNEQFGLGRTASRALADSFRRDAEGKGPETDITALENQSAEQIMSLDQMKDEAAALLDATGLEYQPAKADWFVQIDTEVHLGSEMRLNLKDGQQFVKYLQALYPESITESQKTGLHEIVDVLCAQFQTYDLNDHNDERLLEFMGNLSTIVSEYRRLFGGDVENLPFGLPKLETYLSFARKGYLKEYREAEKLLLNKQPPKKGYILRWHTDANSEYFKKQWNSVLAMLQMISLNKKAGEFYTEVRANAAQALENAAKEISAWPDTRRDKKEFLVIVKNIEGEMSEY